MCSLHRFSAKRDANEPEIVRALTDIGLIVRRVSTHGLPDLAVYSPSERLWRLIEVKMPKGDLRPAQADLMAVAPFPVVTSVADALAIFGVVDGR